jgi:transcriptional regulator GlxA family with amidase domain
MLESPPLDTLIVAGGEGARAVVSSDPMVRFLWEATLVDATRPRRIASVCTGSYILAHAGLLNGRRATTHWSHARHFAECFPRVKVEPDRIFIRHESIWTSAGVTAGIDLSLALIEEDAGQALARRVARQLVVYYRRSGGQSQFSAILEMGPLDHRFVRLMRWMREHLHEDLSVPRLAERLAMSARQFARAFTADLGITPARAVERLRLEVARERIECGAQSIERIALETGFGNTERMRRAFCRAFAQPPGALRRAAQPVTRPGAGNR